MSNETLLKDLAEKLKERGAQSAIASALGVGKSTVGRWVESGEINESHTKLLRLYFYGEIPFENIRPERDLSDILKFTPREYEVISILAKRIGITPGQWIAEQIRTIIAYQASLGYPSLASLPPPEDQNSSRSGSADLA